MKTLIEWNSSLEYHADLNPKLWDGYVLKSDVRNHLLKIAEAFAHYAKISPFTIQDIIFAGSNANYNYTESSDIDVHLLIKDTDIPIKSPDMYRDYMIDKMKLWKSTHNINIYNYNVELYAEPYNESTMVSSGIYSLKHAKWLTKPNNSNLDFNQDFNLLAKLRKWEQKAKAVARSGNPEDINKFRTDLHSMRTQSLATVGEFGHGNLIYKSLRNKGLINKLKDHEHKSLDKKLSLS